MSLLDLIAQHTSPLDRFSQLQQIGMPGALNQPRTGKTTPTEPGPGGNWEQYARQLAESKYGYSPQDFKKLDYIIERESGWNPNAVNDNGGAYGIPQILPSAHPGLNLQHDPVGQIKWLFNYIQQRYGGIDQAYQFKQSHGWY